MNFRGIKKILVIKLRHIGDVLLAVPVFRALRENFPQAHIAALINSGTEDVLTGNPFINEIIVFDRSVKKLSLSRRLWEESVFLRGIKNRHFDMTVDLTGGDRPAIISFISGARYRLGYVTREKIWLKKNIYTHLVRKNGSQHMVIQNLDVVKQFGISTDNLHIDFFVPEEARSFVRKIFEENNIPPFNSPLTKGGYRGVKKGREGVKVVHVHPTSRWLFKCWKDEYMSEVISWLIDQGIKVVVTASPDKREIDKAKRILSLCSKPTPPHIPPLARGGVGGVIDLCGKTSIKQLAAISEASDLFLGVDSAPMHIAAAVGTPVIVLFGPTKENRWRPWGNIHTVISKAQALPCKPCKSTKCKGIVLRSCMEAISPGEVKRAIEQIINKHSEFT